MRICSLVPTATELLYALGVGRSVVARSQRCEYPPGVRRKPIVVRSRIVAGLSSRGIHEAVADMRRRGEHQYRIDVPLLKRLKPDLLITQHLCNVCAASHPEVTEALQALQHPPRVTSIHARGFEDLFTLIRSLGEATGRTPQASALSRRMRRDLEVIRRRIPPAAKKPRVWCAEWLEPLMAAGHWIPELIAMAGGTGGFGRAGGDSPRITWEDVRRYNPEVILVMPCSFTIARTMKERRLLTQRPGWAQLRAVKAGRVFAVNGDLFHHPGPRLVQGVALMAALFHPERFPRPAPAKARPIVS